MPGPSAMEALRSWHDLFLTFRLARVVASMPADHVNGALVPLERYSLDPGGSDCFVESIASISVLPTDWLPALPTSLKLNWSNAPLAALRLMHREVDVAGSGPDRCCYIQHFTISDRFSPKAMH